MSNITQVSYITVGGRNLSLGQDVAAYLLPDLTGDEWDDQASESWAAGVDSLYAFHLPHAQTLYVTTEQGTPTNADVCSESVQDYLAGWDWSSMGYESFAEFLAGWGLDGLSALTTAPDDHDGPCRVWRQPHYYQGTSNAPMPGFVRDQEEEIREFASYTEAAAYVSEYYSAPSGYDGIPACNVLSHGQYGSDTLTIVAAE